MKTLIIGWLISLITYYTSIDYIFCQMGLWGNFLAFIAAIIAFIIVLHIDWYIEFKGLWFVWEWKQWRNK